MLDTSSGSPILATGSVPTNLETAASAPAAIGVRIGPGWIEFARTPLDPSSAAMAFVRPRTPNLEATYPWSPGVPMNPFVDEISVVQSPAAPTLQSLGAWLVSDKSVAAATWGLVVVTFLLVVVTALLVADGFRKSRDQAKRWEEEQERRIAESKPSAIVELAAKEDTPLDMCFACFNLGSNTFYIDRMVVTT
jgi:hypothetical protein